MRSTASNVKSQKENAMTKNTKNNKVGRKESQIYSILEDQLENVSTMGDEQVSEMGVKT